MTFRKARAAFEAAAKRGRLNLEKAGAEIMKLARQDLDQKQVIEVRKLMEQARGRLDGYDKFVRGVAQSIHQAALICFDTSIGENDYMKQIEKDLKQQTKRARKGSGLVLGLGSSGGENEE
jgi:cysteine synthase